MTPPSRCAQPWPETELGLDLSLVRQSPRRALDRSTEHHDGKLHIVGIDRGPDPLLISRSTGSAARAWSTRAQPQTSSTLIRHRLSHDVVECHVYPEMLARSAHAVPRDLATTADSAGTRAEQRVSAPLPVVSGAPLASHQRGVLARWSSPAGRASSRTHSVTSPTEQWIRGREHRTPKAPRVLVVKRSRRRPGCGPLATRNISRPWSGITQSPRVVPAVSFRHGPPYLAHCLRRDRPASRRSTRPPRHLLPRLQRLI